MDSSRTGRPESVKRPAQQRVVAVEGLDVPAVGLAGEAHVVAAPGLEGEEAVEELVVPRAVEHVRGLRQRERRAQEVKGPLHDLPGHVARRVAPGRRTSKLDVLVHSESSPSSRKAHRRGEGRERRDALGVQAAAWMAVSVPPRQ
jgi:hypothetical protein